MTARDAELEVHRAWLGMLQPVGLVVSPSALVSAQAVPERNVVARQEQLRALCREDATVDFAEMAEHFLGWAPDDLTTPDGIEVVLPDYGETLRPDLVVQHEGRPLMLVQLLATGASLDAGPIESHGWKASPQVRLERLLRESGVAAGILHNGGELRIVYAPRGESAGHLTFPVSALLEVSGRPLLAALHMLLSEHRVFSTLSGRRLTDILEVSRRYQSEVSTKLAGQVLGSLWELLRGLQAADELAAGRLLTGVPADAVYGGLLTTLLRLVFLLYAEDKGLMPDEAVYLENYSVSGLYERLREDAGLWPDTMDQRYGGWPWLLSLFRLVHDGGGHAGFQLPARHGQLFDPSLYPFLEGSPELSADFVPRVSDGCLHRVLDKLLMLEGERLSYSALDVEQLGSVYEAMMGFAVERAEGLSIGVRSGGQKPGSVRADVVVDVERLLAEKPATRAKWLKERADCDLKGKGATALQAAKTCEGVVAALGTRVSDYTPQLIPPGGLYLQPGEERRRSGSHYTPRELTEPIVRTTLAPVLETLGTNPTPQQILELKVLDPAMGSGAFLVEACRQLAEKLVSAWELHDALPVIPPDEEPLLHARRLVAQRCLYGVDKNPFAVNLAKLSLWLVTLARDHAFTFLNHALKHGDSLVGLTRRQIAAFHWKEVRPGEQLLFESMDDWMETACGDRNQILGLGDEHEDQKVALLEEADAAVGDLKMAGDLIVSAFFARAADKEREAQRQALRALASDWQRNKEALRESAAGFGERPFHWELEFPEVFDRDSPGFDAIVGNPPFLGGTMITTNLGKDLWSWLTQAYPGTGNRTDLVAYFFRRAYSLLRVGGTFGLVATNTIGQGDTRTGGLTRIRQELGWIYSATKRLRWPGLAAVVVSVVHVRKAVQAPPPVLQGRPVERITAFLFHTGPDGNPAELAANEGRIFEGYKIYGQGFLFDDSDPKSTSLVEMARLIEKDTRNAERIFPYIGGEEVNSDPGHRHHRYVIHFGRMTEAEARAWPDLMSIVEAKVRPERLKLKGSDDPEKLYWWRFWRDRPGLTESIQGLERVLVNARVSQHLAFAFLPTGLVYSEQLEVYPLPCYTTFCTLQSRTHEVWARFFSSTLEDRLRYVGSDCFGTFPFPAEVQTSQTLKECGREYYEFRASLMLELQEGLTQTYNRFHDPDERNPQILRLRELHAAMDRAVLDAYGWNNIPTECQFLLDYEIDEESWGKKKKPWRYRWPDEVHDEVLARLLVLNKSLAEEERLVGPGQKAKTTRRKPPRIEIETEPQSDPVTHPLLVEVDS